MILELSNYAYKNSKIKCTAHNERFHASGGAVSYDTEQVTASFALVRAFVNPHPTAKPPGVACNVWRQCTLQFISIIKTNKKA